MSNVETVVRGGFAGLTLAVRALSVQMSQEQLAGAQAFLVTHLSECLRGMSALEQHLARETIKQALEVPTAGDAPPAASRPRRSLVTKRERSELYRDILTGHGYGAEINDQGDVVFKHDGGTYFVAISEDDEVYFSLVCANFWPIESEEEQEEVRRAAAVATSGTKVAKVFPVDDNVWATIEMFCDPPEVVAPSIPRAMDALQHAVALFREQMQA